MTTSETITHAETVRRLAEVRRERCFPVRVRTMAKEIAERTLALLFPHFSDAVPCDEVSLAREVAELRDQLLEFVKSTAPSLPHAAQLADDFIETLPAIHTMLVADANAIQEGDPAAAGFDEVVVAYPGFYAIAIFRVANALHRMGFPLLPRLLTEHAHRETGVDIHPGATIGRGFVIDHGTGIVIGESAEIGNGVKLYQGVTLGAMTVQKDLAATKRHPTIQDNVVIYANATILGGETTIGHDSIVGGNAFLATSIPPFSSVGRSQEVRPRKSAQDFSLEFYI